MTNQRFKIIKHLLHLFATLEREKEKECEGSKEKKSKAEVHGAIRVRSK